MKKYGSVNFSSVCNLHVFLQRTLAVTGAGDLAVAAQNSAHFMWRGGVR